MNPVAKAPVIVSIPLGSFNLSGGIKVLVALANGMAARDWHVTFLVPDFASRSPFPLSFGVRVKIISSGPAWLPFMVRKAYYYLKLAYWAAYKSDICLANYYPTAYCAVLSKLFVNRKAAIYYYIQGYEAQSHGLIAEANPISRMIRYLLARGSYNLPVSVICVSQWVRERIGCPDGRVAHAPNLDSKVFRPLKRERIDSRLVVGTIGRKGKTKGYRYFLEALRLLPDRSGLKVLVASPLTNEVPLPSGVSAEGVLALSEEAMIDFYNRCDIFVLASLVEGFPLPPLEAMACGCAVIVTDCGGVRDYAHEGVNCLVVPPGDPQALAEGLWTLGQDPSLRKDLAHEGQRTARRFEKEEMVKKFIDLITVESKPIEHLREERVWK